MIDRAHRHKELAAIMSVGRAMLDWSNVSSKALTSLYQTLNSHKTSEFTLGKSTNHIAA